MNILYSATHSNIKQLDHPDTTKADLALVILPKQTITSGVFTTNAMCAAPVRIAKSHIATIHPKAFVINSGNANAGTGIKSGEEGYDTAIDICALVAGELDIKQSEVLPFSTGVIGQQLPMSSFTGHIPSLVASAHTNSLSEVAHAIMTTDTYAKQVTKELIIGGKPVAIHGIAKGSGMIHPNMATMLGFVFTDIIATKAQLDSALHQAVNVSFNRITVDGDTSTNDACTLSATGESGVKYCQEFQEALNSVMTELAQMIVRDGEGATKFVSINVSADTSTHALKVAHSVALSPLVKTALFASDANWGRILAAVGKADIPELEQEMIDIYLGDTCLVTNGSVCSEYTEEIGSAFFAESEIDIRIIINNAKVLVTETVWTTDLSYEYIKINAEYRT